MHVYMFIYGLRCVGNVPLLHDARAKYTNIFMHVPPQPQIGFPNLLKCVCKNMCARSELARRFVLCDICISEVAESRDCHKQECIAPDDGLCQSL